MICRNFMDHGSTSFPCLGVQKLLSPSDKNMFVHNFPSCKVVIIHKQHLMFKYWHYMVYFWLLWFTSPCNSYDKSIGKTDSKEVWSMRPHMVCVVMGASKFCFYRNIWINVNFRCKFVAKSQQQQIIKKLARDLEMELTIYYLVTKHFGIR